jgi:cysteinyl-tRNA synthetase
MWKGAKPGEPSWESPWGPGRPGWHIECSAMSMKLLGETLDIHGGGLDLQFPHHENELAQSESYTDKPFARYWLHNGLLKLRSQEGKSEKMAGSVGNVINIADLLREHQAETVRFLLLGTHYRSPIEYSDERLQEVERSLDSYYRLFERFQRVTGKNFYDLKPPTTKKKFDNDGSTAELLIDVQRFWEAFLDHMDSDFNTGGAIGVLFELLKLLNRFADTKQLEAGKGDAADLKAFERGVLVLKELSQILGLFQAPPQAKQGDQGELLEKLQHLLVELNVTQAAAATVEGTVQHLIDLRAAARKAKNFALGDQIRKRLADLGVTLEDRPGGTGWRLG